MIDRSTETQIQLDRIQGDILVGLQKEAQLFVGFAIADVTRFKRFLAGLHLTSGRDALLAEDRIAAFRANGGTGLLDIRGVNIAFTHDGLKRLGLANTAQIKDAAFKAGLAARSGGLNDPPTGIGAVMADLDHAAGDGTWTPFYTEMGTTRPGPMHGHEHFGYLDGVSQPSVRGRVDGVLPNHQFLNPGQNPDDPNQGLPGSDLHWPGEFVFGYPEQDSTDVEKFKAPKDGGLPWMKNGSFMVFRRLEQLVPEFHETARVKAQALNEPAAILEARMVGRFRSGSPITLSPADNPSLGGNPLKNNDFDFGDGDITGAKCPYSSHIRKSYPRNDLTPAAGGQTGEAGHMLSEADTQTHRVMRRGIPFGPELTGSETASKTTQSSRGLMFVCYQTSIEDQFEFIIQNWVNNKQFAIGDSGFDPILGQAHGADRSRSFTGAQPNATSGQPPEVTLEKDFIRPTGGGYFFMPSIDAVRSVLAA